MTGLIYAISGSTLEVWCRTKELFGGKESVWIHDLYLERGEISTISAKHFEPYDGYINPCNLNDAYCIGADNNLYWTKNPKDESPKLYETFGYSKTRIPTDVQFQRFATLQDIEAIMQTILPN